eukprot:395548-Pelagomonas_calceolata.AAC.2
MRSTSCASSCCCSCWVGDSRTDCSSGIHSMGLRLKLEALLRFEVGLLRAKGGGGPLGVVVVMGAVEPAAVDVVAGDAAAAAAAAAA